MIHLAVREALQGLAVCGVLFHLQKSIHRAPPAVISGSSSGNVAVVALHAQVQVIASEPDAGLRVVEICKEQAFVRCDLAAQPDKGLLGHLHQAPGIHSGGGLRVKAAFGADEGIHQKRVEVVGVGPALHQRFVLTGV